MKKRAARGILVDILYDLVGCFIFAVSIQSFSAPNNIAPGGVSGAAILINYLSGLPISALNLALNIPLLVMAWMLIGKQFTAKTIKSVVILTLMLELCAGLPVYRGDMILASLYGGVLQGAGISLVFMRSSTTGGTDVASRLLQIKFPHIQVGKLMIAVDGVVLVASAIIYRNIENALYAMIVIYVCGLVLDSILYGIDRGKVMMVISDRYGEIVRRIDQELDRGCTILEGRGGHTGQDKHVLLCAVSKRQFIGLKRLVRDVDEDAFILALDATEIIGEGFKQDITT